MRLNELFKRGEGEYVIGYKQYVWLLDNEDVEEESEVYQDMHSTLNKEREGGFPEYGDIYELNGDVFDDEYPDMVIGRVVNGSLHMIGDSNFRHSTASKTLLKIMDELDISKVVLQGVHFYNDSEYEFEYEQTKEEFLKPLSEKFFYHGTDLVSLKNILKTGIRPQGGKSNYGKVQHDDKVFVTLNPERADFHASVSSNNNNSFPVVIKMKIPDVDKLVLDYDVAVDMYGYEHELTMSLGYDDILNHATSGNYTFKKNLTSFVPQNELDQVRDKSSLNTKLGIFGYIGRIPSSAFVGLFINEDNVRSQVMMDIFGYDKEDVGIQTILGNYTEYTVKEYIEEYKDIQEEIDDAMEDEDDY